MSPEVGANDNSPFGGVDGLGGYMPLALVTTSGTLNWVHAYHLGAPMSTPTPAAPRSDRPPATAPPVSPASRVRSQTSTTTATAIMTRPPGDISRPTLLG